MDGRVMSVRRLRSGVWFHVLLAAGAALAIALLVQTVVNYRYVSNSLTLQEARRVAAERVRNVERTARLARPQDPEAFRVVLDDIRADTGDQLAAIAMLHGDGTLVASSGQPSTGGAAPERARVTGRDTALAREWRAGREVVFVVFPCRCGLPRQPADRALPSGRLLVEVGLYRDSLTAPFARLRRDATISASAALALLVSVLLIATWWGPYVRGKQLEVEMDLARQVQRDLLPAAGSRSGRIDIAAECRPASQVGGDFYDIVALPGDRVSFVLGDVSGHGVSSALLMALIHEWTKRLNEGELNMLTARRPGSMHCCWRNHRANDSRRCSGACTTPRPACCVMSMPVIRRPSGVTERRTGHGSSIVSPKADRCSAFSTARAIARQRYRRRAGTSWCCSPTASPRRRTIATSRSATTG